MCHFVCVIEQVDMSSVCVVLHICLARVSVCECVWCELLSRGDDELIMERHETEIKEQMRTGREMEG